MFAKAGHAIQPNQQLIQLCIVTAYSRGLSLNLAAGIGGPTGVQDHQVWPCPADRGRPGSAALLPEAAGSSRGGLQGHARLQGGLHGSCQLGSQPDRGHLCHASPHCCLQEEESSGQLFLLLLLRTGITPRSAACMATSKTSSRQENIMLRKPACRSCCNTRSVVGMLKPFFDSCDVASEHCFQQKSLLHCNCPPPRCMSSCR